MNRTALLVVAAAAVAACAKSDKPADTSAPAAAVATNTPAAIKLSDVAGSWNVVGRDANTDSTLATYVLKATADTAGWTITFPNRPPVAMHVLSVGGDSIVTQSASYESVLRKG